MAVEEMCWLLKLLSDFRFNMIQSPIKIFEDNQSAIRISYNPENNPRLKHVDIEFNFIKEKIEKGIIEIVKIKTEDQEADILTKPLSKIKFDKFCRMIGLV